MTFEVFGATPYHRQIGSKKRKLHPLCLMGLPKSKRQLLQEDDSETEDEDSSYQE